MPRSINRKNQSACVGLDIGSHSIKAVELVQQSGELLIGAADCVPTPPGALVDGAVRDRGAVAHGLHALWKRGRFGSRRAVLALDQRQVSIRWYHLEVEEGQSLEDTAHGAALRGLPYPAHEAVTDFRVLATRQRRGRTLHHLALFAVRADAVDSLLSAAEMAHIEPVSVDVSPMAIVRTASGNNKWGTSLWSGQPEAHCLIGSENTIVSIRRDHGVEFARSIPVGGRQITQLIAAQVGCDEEAAEKIKHSPNARMEPNGTLLSETPKGPIEVSCETVLERLTREIARSLRHFQSQFPEGSYLGMIGRVFLSGGAVRLRGLDKVLADRIADEVHTVNPFAGLSVLGTGFGLERVQSATSAYSLAMGLALGHHWSSEASSVAEAA